MQTTFASAPAHGILAQPTIEEGTMDKAMKADRAMAYLRCGCSFEEAAETAGMTVAEVMNLWHEAAKVRPPITVGRVLLKGIQWALVIIVLAFFAYAAITDTSPECPQISCGIKESARHFHG